MKNIKPKINKNIQAWMALGPLLIALCMFTSTLSMHSASFPFIFCGFAGLFLILQWQKQGLMIALALLLVTAITLFFYQKNVEHPIWILFNLSSMAMSLVITKLALEESQELLSQFLAQRKIPERQITQIEETHKIAEEEWIQHRNELLKKIDILKDEKEELIASQQRIIDQSQKEALEPAKESVVPPKTISTESVIQQPIESITTAETEASTEIDTIKKIGPPQPNYQALYKELRVQFEEKSQILNETRQQLFHANEQVLALQKDKEELHLAGNQPYSAALEKHIIRMDGNQKKHEKFLLEEIDALHGLVSTLLQQ